MGFAELFVIAIVGLIVIGPDKLPQTIKTCLTWFGRLKRLVNDTRTEFEQQLGVDEIRREIHNEEVMASLKAIKDAKNKTVSQVQNYADKARQETKIFDDFDSDDEGLFGEQYANHPPEPEDSSEHHKSEDKNIHKSLSKDRSKKTTSKSEKPNVHTDEENLQNK